MLVTKRDGSTQVLDLDKIHAVIEWACNGDIRNGLKPIKGVSVSQIEMSAQPHFHNKIKTSDIHATITKAAASLISEDTPNYDHVAARLRWFDVRKKAFQSNDPPHLLEVIKANTKRGIYDPDLLEYYSLEEWGTIDGFIDHTRDDLFRYAGAEQMTAKYLAQNRKTKKIYETFQFPYILVSAILFRNYPKGTRLDYVKRYYDQVSQHYVSLPTPIMAGLRTKTKQFSSCFPAGQLVLTSSGHKKIEDIKVGDKVLSRSGRYNKVEAIRSKSNEEIFTKFHHNFTFSNPFISTSSHEVLSLKREELLTPDRRIITPEWREVDSLKNGDYIQIPFNKEIVDYSYLSISTYVDLPSIGYRVDADGIIRKLNSSPKRHEGCEYVFNTTAIPDKILCNGDFFRLIGYFLVKGHLHSTDTSTNFTFGTCETDTWIKDVIHISKNLLGYTPSVHSSTKVSINSKPFTLFIKALLGTGFANKRLSPLFLKASPSKQKELLIGIIRGDGCVHKLGVTLGMANMELISQLGFLALRCGLYPSFSATQPSGISKGVILSRNTLYNLHLYSGPDRDFILDIHKNNHKLGERTGKLYITSRYLNGEFFTKIRNKESMTLPGELVYDLQVETEQSFTVQGVCVHNCTLIDSGDSLSSITSSATAIVNYASQKAGIGINLGRIRAVGQAVRGGDAVTTGIMPFAKLFAAALKSCSQGAVRGASATFNYPIWHLEFETLIEAKNNKGTPETRLTVVDYCVHLNKTMYERLLSKGNITFFSPDEVPDLYEAFYGPNKEFKVLYEKYEADTKKTKKVLPAVEVFTKLISERFGTGRIYIMNADHANTNSPFHEKIYMTNLCCEILLPTTPMGTDESLIALCTLSALNWGKIQSEAEMAEAAEMSVRGLDELLDYQNYPNEAAERHTKLYRPLGIGIIGLAHDMVRNGKVWGKEESWDWVEQKMEAMSYFLTKTSIGLAKEKGSCPRRTKYHDGIFPMDTAVGGVSPNYDWEILKEDAKKYGIRNATLMALMPSETSSQLANETNGIEPPRHLITNKGNKDATTAQVVPEYSKYNHAYEIAWNIPVSDYLQVIGRLQKYVDQAASSNTSYNPNTQEVTVKTLLSDLLLSYKLGLKTLYYSNTNTDSIVEDDCESGACKI